MANHLQNCDVIVIACLQFDVKQATGKCNT